MIGFLLQKTPNPLQPISQIQFYEKININKVLMADEYISNFNQAVEPEKPSK